MSAPPAAHIAVASGKGGTGKTTVAAHLALAAARSQASALIDLDVEAPDSLAYFPDASLEEPVQTVAVAVPQLVEAQCSGCGRCAKACRFGAIINIRGVISIDQQLCKGCARCVAICPHAALVEAPVLVGTVSKYRSGELLIIEGRMRVGDIRSTALIEAAKRQARVSNARILIRDCPPGVSCPATHAMAGADFAVLVAEPTEFSLHDLEAALSLAEELGIPAGVIINKNGFGSSDIGALCAPRGVPVLARIGFDRERASSGADARLWADDANLMADMERVLETALMHLSSRKGVPA